MYVSTALSLLLAFIASLRVRGCFYALLLSSCMAVAIYLANRKTLNLVIPSQIKGSAYILALYQLLVFLAQFIKHGFSSQELFYVVNIPLLFSVGSFWSLSVGTRNNIKASNGLLKILPFCYAAGAVLGSVSSIVVLHQSSPSSFRSHELLFSIGLLIALIGLIKVSNFRDNNPFCFLVTGPIALVLALQFKGIIGFTSGIIFVGFCINQLVLASRLQSSKLKKFFFITASLFVLMTLLLVFDSKVLIFKWTLYSLISDDPLNGRLALWREALLTWHQVGLFNGVKQEPVDAHNFVLNTISHSGIIPSFIAVCVISYLFLALLGSEQSPEKKWFIGIFVVIILGSFIQPVQFSDGIAYQLSFFAIGALSATSFATQAGCHT